jgi:glutamine synthetase
MDTVREVTDEDREWARSLADKGVEYVFASFIDITGRAKSKCVPIGRAGDLLAGHERYTPRGIGNLGVMTPNEDECVAIPDPETLCILPWDRRIAMMTADLYFGGEKPFAHCTRSILKRQVEAAKEAGFGMCLGVEPELYIVKDPKQVAAAPDRPHGYLEPTASSGQLRPSPAYDVESTLDAMGFLEPIVKAMNEAGFGVFSFDHEGGDGQYEFDFDFASALQMADRLTLFRLMVKQMAKQVGMFATFMPKPYTESWGSGAHFNMSLVDAATGENVFRDADDERGRGWSKIAYSFVAGILRHAPALSAVCTPTVNSFKRLQPRLSDGTVSWAPVWAAYGDNNRSCMLRLPRNRPCVEDRCVDSTANPYLAAAFLFAAGIEGVTEGLDPGDPVEDITYEWQSASGRDGAAPSRLPRNLLEAIEAFDQDPLTETVFPADFKSTYVAMKLAEWNEYHAQVTDWERDYFLRMS